MSILDKFKIFCNIRIYIINLMTSRETLKENQGRFSGLENRHILFGIIKLFFIPIGRWSSQWYQSGLYITTSVIADPSIPR